MNKKKLVLITNFSSLSVTLNHYKDLINDLSRFIDIIIINAQFKKIKKNKKIKEFSFFNFPENVKIFFLTKKEYTAFFKNKFVIWNNFSFSIEYFFIHLLIKKFKKKQIIISNSGNLQWGIQFSSENLLCSAFNYLRKKLNKFFFAFLINLKFIRPIDVRFQSIKKIAFYKNSIFIKKFNSINSNLNDYYKKNKIKISNKFITHIDLNVNHEDDVTLRGKFSSKKTYIHYKNLNIILKKLSKIYNKKVVVCIHPLYNKSKIQKYFPDFKVYKFKTREMINRSELVTFFDSTTIFNAVYLKKKIIIFRNTQLGKNMSIKSDKYCNLLGIPRIDIDKVVDIKKKEIENHFTRSKNLFEKYIYRYLKINNNYGYEEVIKFIRNEEPIN